MIKSFANEQTEGVYLRESDKKLPAEVQRVALRKLRMINNAKSIRTFAPRLEIGLRSGEAIVPGNTRSGLMISGESALIGGLTTPTRLRLLIITRR